LKIQKKFKAQAIPGIKILRYEESLYYANVEYFKYQVYKQVGLKPEDEIIRAKRGGIKGYENGGFDVRNKFPFILIAS
jgi:MFS superfamily sulfate permease-like transporter